MRTAGLRLWRCVKRRFLILLTALSLLLCVPVIAAWRPSFTYEWSYRSGPYAHYASYLPDPYSYLGIAALLLAAAAAWFGFDLRRRLLVAAALAYVPSAVGLGWITVAWLCNTGVGSWLPAIQMATGPTVSGILLGREAHVRLRAALDRRQRRHGADPCLHCGYDLRATPGRCPECGTTPAVMAAP